MKKRTVALLMGLCISACMIGCGSKDDAAATTEAETVVEETADAAERND